MVSPNFSGWFDEILGCGPEDRKKDSVLAQLVLVGLVFWPTT
jgi:hypothetical protein